MNPKTCNIICIILAILIVALLVRAATNKGKIWGSEEKYRNFTPGLPPGFDFSSFYMPNVSLSPEEIAQASGGGGMRFFTGL